MWEEGGKGAGKEMKIEWNFATVVVVVVAAAAAAAAAAEHRD